MTWRDVSGWFHEIDVAKSCGVLFIYYLDLITLVGGDRGGGAQMEAIGGQWN